MVDELDHLPRGAEVAREVARRGAERRARAQERGDVGAAEPVDRLLGVADDEQAPRIDLDLVPAPVARVRVARREQRGEVALDGIGVLELVEQQVRVAGAEPAPNVPAVTRIAEQRAREHEQVVELELAAPAALVGFAERELRDLPRQAPDRGLGDGVA